MKELITITTIFLLATIAVAGQTSDVGKKADTFKTSDDPAAIPDLLFKAMREKTQENIRGLFLPEGQLVALDKPRDGKGFSNPRTFFPEGFAKNIANVKGEIIETMPEKKVEITGDLAVVSGRYTLHIGDKFSHCGLNTFNLLRTESGWKIVNAASTLIFQCDEYLKTPIAPRPEDVSSIDGIVKAFYEVISGSKGTSRQWDRDRTLYIKDVRFVQISKQGTRALPNVMDHNEYVKGTEPFLVKEGFIEREINRVTKQYGNIAQVASTYEWEASDGMLKGRGINYIQLYNDGARWWISAVSWEGETPGNPIPAEYLPKKKR